MVIWSVLRQKVCIEHRHHEQLDVAVRSYQSNQHHTLSIKVTFSVLFSLHFFLSVWNNCCCDGQYTLTFSTTHEKLSDSKCVSIVLALAVFFFYFVSWDSLPFSIYQLKFMVSIQYRGKQEFRLEMLIVDLLLECLFIFFSSCIRSTYVWLVFTQAHAHTNLPHVQHRILDVAKNLPIFAIQL